MEMVREVERSKQRAQHFLFAVPVPTEQCRVVPASSLFDDYFALCTQNLCVRMYRMQQEPRKAQHSHH